MIGGDGADRTNGENAERKVGENADRTNGENAERTDRESLRLDLNGTDWKLAGWYRHQWRIGTSMELGAKLHPVLPAVEASVPGAVQTDLMRARRLPDPNLGLRSLEIEWVNNRDWLYEKSFVLPDGWLGDRCDLELEGLDDTGEIYFNGSKLAAFEGMFVPLRFDVTSLLRGPGMPNELKIVFVASEEVDGQIGYSSRIRKLKSRFNYGWDWCPRIVPVGIWGNVKLHTYAGLRIAEFFPRTMWNDGKRGSIELRTTVSALRSGRYSFEYRLTDERGDAVLERTDLVELRGGDHIVIGRVDTDSVDPWWPNGWGRQPLYDISVTVRDEQGAICDGEKKTVGFRRVEFAPNPGAPADALPYTLVVNGRRIFMRGVNWVPIRPFYGDVRADDYALHLGRFRAMNANLVRVWGGAICEKEAFYDYCDRNGLLVWQEFLQSSSGIDNCPPEDPAFLDQLELVSRTMVRRRRHHASHLLWCGGNELMWDDYVPVHDRHRNIAMLRRVVREEDPGKPFLPASASGPTFCDGENGFGRGVHHDVHGPWDYLGDTHHYRFFDRNDALLRTESGTPGASRAELLRRYADGHPLWPPTEENAYWAHRGSFWIQWEQLSAQFGAWSENEDELDVYVQASRFLQMESLRYMAESTRRREPESSGFLVWMGNEPFANNANTSLIEHDAVPKPAFYAIRAAFAERHAAARYERVAWRGGETWFADLYIHDDLRDKDERTLRVKALLLQADGVALAEKSFDIPASAAAPRNHIGRMEWKIASVPYGVMLLRLVLEDGKNGEPAVNTYVFTVDAGHPFEPLRRLPPAEIHLDRGREGGGIAVTNAGDIVAAGVFAIPVHPAESPILLQNYFFLLPGETALLRSADGTALSPNMFRLEWMNQ